MNREREEPTRPRLGISACLVGAPVRYDGAAKPAPNIVAALAGMFELVPFCPEQEIGLGVPRESIHLVDRGDGVRLLGAISARDHSTAMAAYAARRIDELWPLGGCVLKARSPSCGIRGVPVFSDVIGCVPPVLGDLAQRHGWPIETSDAPLPSRRGQGAGFFVRLLLERRPDLPVVDEDELRDEAALADFARRVRVYWAS